MKTAILWCVLAGIAVTVLSPLSVDGLFLKKGIRAKRAPINCDPQKPTTHTEKTNGQHPNTHHADNLKTQDHHDEKALKHTEAQIIPSAPSLEQNTFQQNAQINQNIHGAGAGHAYPQNPYFQNTHGTSGNNGMNNHNEHGQHQAETGHPNQNNAHPQNTQGAFGYDNYGSEYDSRRIQPWQVQSTGQAVVDIIRNSNNNGGNNGYSFQGSLNPFNTYSQLGNSYRGINPQGGSFGNSINGYNQQGGSFGTPFNGYNQQGGLFGTPFNGYNQQGGILGNLLNGYNPLGGMSNGNQLNGISPQGSSNGYFNKGQVEGYINPAFDNGNNGNQVVIPSTIQATSTTTTTTSTSQPGTPSTTTTTTPSTTSTTTSTPSPQSIEKVDSAPVNQVNVGDANKLNDQGKKTNSDEYEYDDDTEIGKIVQSQVNKGTAENDTFGVKNLTELEIDQSNTQYGHSGKDTAGPQDSVKPTDYDFEFFKFYAVDTLPQNEVNQNTAENSTNERNESTERTAKSKADEEDTQYNYDDEDVTQTEKPVEQIISDYVETNNPAQSQVYQNTIENATIVKNEPIEQTQESVNHVSDSKQSDFVNESLFSQYNDYNSMIEQKGTQHETKNSSQVSLYTAEVATAPGKESEEQTNVSSVETQQERKSEIPADNRSEATVVGSENEITKNDENNGDTAGKNNEYEKQTVSENGDSAKTVEKVGNPEMEHYDDA